MENYLNVQSILINRFNNNIDLLFHTFFVANFVKKKNVQKNVQKNFDFILVIEVVQSLTARSH